MTEYPLPSGSYPLIAIRLWYFLTFLKLQICVTLIKVISEDFVGMKYCIYSWMESKLSLLYNFLSFSNRQICFLIYGIVSIFRVPCQKRFLKLLGHALVYSCVCMQWVHVCLYTLKKSNDYGFRRIQI